jgi:hypothetical protein
MGWTAGVRFQARGRFFFLHSVQNGCKVHPVTYPMGNWAKFPEGKVEGGVKLTIHLYLLPRSRMMELYLHSPVRLHGTVLN